MVVFTAWVMSSQIGDRFGFANADLKRDVMERWGAPIVQAAPSVRYAESGAVFNELRALAFDAQALAIHSRMSYRKRGLVYFSGFEFSFDGKFVVTNPKSFPIDMVFVFPVQSQSNRILLSNLEFLVEGEAQTLPLDVGTDKLVWTGRVQGAESKSFQIRFKGQGLDRFTYVLDPALAVRDFSLVVDIEGGDNYDYDFGIVPAHVVQADDDAIRLSWQFESLESGVPVGVSLPSETSFDSIITTMALRSWATFTLFFIALILLFRVSGLTLAWHDAYLVSGMYAFFFVLLPYLAAYMNFYLAFLVSACVVSYLLFTHLTRLLGMDSGWLVLAMVLALLVVPTLAVVFQEHTGLIYSLEILAGLFAVALLSTNPKFRAAVASIHEAPHTGELIHAPE